MRVTHLCAPPPLSSLKIVVQACPASLIQVVLLGDEDQVRGEFGITVQSLDAFNNVAKVYIEAHAVHNDNTTMKLRTARKLPIDDPIELFRVLIR